MKRREGVGQGSQEMALHYHAGEYLFEFIDIPFACLLSQAALDH